MTAPVDLDHLDALAKAAPLGPYTLNEDEECISNPTGTWPIETSRFMVAACNAYPAMSAELRLLRNVVEGQARLLDTAVRPDIHKAT